MGLRATDAAICASSSQLRTTLSATARGSTRTPLSCAVRRSASSFAARGRAIGGIYQQSLASHLGANAIRRATGRERGALTECEIAQDARPTPLAAELRRSASTLPALIASERQLHIEHLSFEGLFRA